MGTHTVGYNDRAVAYSMIGNFEDFPVPQVMLDTAAALIGCAVVDLVRRLLQLFSGHNL